MTARSPLRTLLIAILLTLLAFVPGMTGAQVFRESTSVVVVEVPVHVIRDGKPVRGLTHEDFVVLDERKPQEIIGFDVVDLTALSSPSPAPAAGRSVAPPARMPVAARRHFLLLFDLSFSRPDSVTDARDAALELVKEGLHPSDLVAVATYSHGRGPQLLNGFTSDRPQVAAAIDSLGLTRRIEPLRDPLGLVFGDLDDAGRAFGLGQGSSGRGAGGRGRGDFAAAMMDFARKMEAQQQRQETQRISALTRSFSDLATLMAGVRGRKHVIYLSEGFDTSALFGTADVERTRRMSSASEEGRVWEIDSEERYGDTHAQNQLEQMFSAFRRADCTVQTVDVGGMQRIAGVESGSQRTTERTRTTLAARHDSLAIIASATGGEFFRHFNNLSEAMGEVLERTGVTYVLAYQPEKIDLDGGYHRLKVKLKDSSKGRLVHRPGYYAPRPFGELSGEEQRLSTAELIVGGRDGGAIAATVFAAPFASRRAAGAYVPMFFEIDGSSLVAAVPGRSLTADVYAYALDTDGRVRDFLGHTLAIDLEQVRPMLEQSGVKFYGHFDLTAGDYTLRVLARDRESGLYALESIGLTVPDFAAAEPALLPPLFVEAPGKWMMAREELAAGEERPAFPFMVGRQPFLPAARPVVRRGASVAVNLMAYHLGERPEVEIRIRTALGAELSEPALAVTGSVAGAAGQVAFEASFDTGLLDAGEYTLEITAEDPASGRRASSSGPFVVD